jgi:hypothetical protein
LSHPAAALLLLLYLQNESVVDSEEADEDGSEEADEDEEEGLSWEELEEEARR